MIHYILMGFDAFMAFQDKDFDKLKEALTNEENDLLIYNPQESNFSLLINKLDGFSDFLEITKEDFETIKKETSLEFNELDSVSMPIYWSTRDFEKQAEHNFKFLKENHADEFKHLDDWQQLYDKSTFAEQLEKMIKNHDSNNGINWFTVDEYLSECEIK